jgi:hypothetical protein
MADVPPGQSRDLAAAFDEAMSTPPAPAGTGPRPPGFDYQPPPPPPPLIEPPPPPVPPPMQSATARGALSHAADALRRSASVYGTVGVTVLVLAAGAFVFAVVAQVMKSNATGVLAGLVIAVGLLIAGILLLGFSTLFGALVELSQSLRNRSR